MRACLYVCVCALLRLIVRNIDTLQITLLHRRSQSKKQRTRRSQTIYQAVSTYIKEEAVNIEG